MATYDYEGSDEASESELLDRSLSLWTGWSSVEKVAGLAPVPLDLHTASSIGQYDKVRSIIQRGEEDLNRKNQGGWSALMYACYIGHDNIVNLLLEAHVRVNDTNLKGQTPLMLAASCGNESVAYFLLQQGAELEAADNKGWTALFHATYSGHQNMVKFLLDNGANAQTVEPGRQYTPLMEAAAEGHEIIVQCFLLHGVNVNAKAANGDTARSLALISGHMKIVSLIDNHTMTPHSARAEPSLLQRSADLSSSDEAYQRPRPVTSKGSRSKVKGPKITDGPMAFDLMMQKSEYVPPMSPTVIQDAYVPRGYVTFQDDSQLPDSSKMTLRDVTSPIQPDDFYKSSGLDDTHGFNKSGALTIKSSSGSHGGLIGALGLSQDSGEEADINENVPKDTGRDQLPRKSSSHGSPQRQQRGPPDRHQRPPRNQRSPGRASQTTLRQDITAGVQEYLQGLTLNPQAVPQVPGYQHPSLPRQPQQLQAYPPHPGGYSARQPYPSQPQGRPILSSQNYQAAGPQQNNPSQNQMYSNPQQPHSPRPQLGAETSRPQDLETLLAEMGLSKYFHIFEEQDVDLQVFLSLTDNDLKEVGIKLFGPRRKMTTAIARWHSNIRPRCSDIEQAYADRLEAEMQELAIQLHRSCEQVENLKAQVLQERELRSVAESCLMEAKTAWQQVRHLASDTRGHCREVQQLLSCARLYEEEFSRRLSQGTSAGEHSASMGDHQGANQSDISSLSTSQLTGQIMHMHSEAQRHLVGASTNMDQLLGKEIDYSRIEGES